MRGWTSPRLRVRFDLDGMDLCLTRPDGRRFTSYVELMRWGESAQQRAEREALRAESAEQRAESAEQRAESAEQRAESAEQRVESAEQRAEREAQRAATAESELARLRALLQQQGIDFAG